MVYVLERSTAYVSVCKRRHRMGEFASTDMKRNPTTCICLTKADSLQVAMGENLADWLALELSWSFVSPPAKVKDNTWKFSIEMTFGTRLAPHYHERGFWFQGEELKNHLRNPPPPSEAPFRWAPLRPAAFRPKIFNITLSQGRFISPWDLAIKKPYPIFQSGQDRFIPSRYLSQLTFDVSPFPPREEYAEGGVPGVSGHVLDRQHFWEMKVFARDTIDRKDQTWAETLDLGWWLSPTNGKWNEYYGR
jgi:hypothetical protein